MRGERPDIVVLDVGLPQMDGWTVLERIGPDRVKYSVLRPRRKLGATAGADSMIEVVRGFGYRYRVRSA